MGIQRIHNNVLHSSYATRKIYSEKFFKSIWNAIKYFLKLFLKVCCMD